MVFNKNDRPSGGSKREPNRRSKRSSLTSKEISIDDSSPSVSSAPPEPRTRLTSFRALVLNSSYQPVKLVSWQRALLLWFQGKVEVVEYHSAVARSARTEFPIPSILRLKRFVNHRRFARVKFCRENVYRRDDYTCQYCGERFQAKELTLDHVVPASKRGRKDWTNMVTACRKCNHRKANRTPLAAGMPLLSEPKVPNWLPPIERQWRMDVVPESWRIYLSSPGDEEVAIEDWNNMTG